jgi:hypothetical protein
MKLPSKEIQFEILSECVKKVMSQTDERDKVQVVVSSISKLFNNSPCMVSILDGDQLRIIAANENIERGGFVGLTYPITGSVTGSVVSTQNPVSLSVPENDRYMQFATSMMSELAIPIPAMNKTVGVLSLESRERNAFHRSDTIPLEPYTAILQNSVSKLAALDKNEQPTFETLHRMRQKQVLILGKDTPPEDQLLFSIGESLRQKGYTSLLVKSFPDFRELSNEDKVRVFADVSRFVVIENSYPAGQIVECKICAMNRIVTTMLRQEGRGSSYMVTDYSKDFDFMREFVYKTTTLSDTLDVALSWAEQKVEERAAYFDEKYPWRTGREDDPSHETGGA